MNNKLYFLKKAGMRFFIAMFALAISSEFASGQNLNIGGAGNINNNTTTVNVYRPNGTAGHTVDIVMWRGSGWGGGENNASTEYVYSTNLPAGTYQWIENHGTLNDGVVGGENAAGSGDYPDIQQTNSKRAFCVLRINSTVAAGNYTVTLTRTSNSNSRTVTLGIVNPPATGVHYLTVNGSPSTNPDPDTVINIHAGSTIASLTLQYGGDATEWGTNYNHNNQSQFRYLTNLPAGSYSWVDVAGSSHNDRPYVETDNDGVVAGNMASNAQTIIQINGGPASRPPAGDYSIVLNRLRINANTTHIRSAEAVVRVRHRPSLTINTNPSWNGDIDTQVITRPGGMSTVSLDLARHPDEVGWGANANSASTDYEWVFNAPPGTFSWSGPVVVNGGGTNASNTQIALTLNSTIPYGIYTIYLKRSDDNSIYATARVNVVAPKINVYSEESSSQQPFVLTVQRPTSGNIDIPLSRPYSEGWGENPNLAGTGYTWADNLSGTSFIENVGTSNDGIVNGTGNSAASLRINSSTAFGDHEVTLVRNSDNSIQALAIVRVVSAYVRPQTYAEDDVVTIPVTRTGGNSSSAWRITPTSPGVEWADGGANGTGYSGGTTRLLRIRNTAFMGNSSNTQNYSIQILNSNTVDIQLADNNNIVITPRAAMVWPANNTITNVTSPDRRAFLRFRGTLGAGTWAVTCDSVKRGVGSAAPLGDFVSVALLPNFTPMTSAQQVNIQLRVPPAGAAADTAFYTIHYTFGGNTYSSPFTIYPTNMWATCNRGRDAAAYNISNGKYFAGPTYLFDPFPNSNDENTGTTAAMGRSPYPNPMEGSFYYLYRNSSGNSGVARVYGANGDGSGAETQLIQKDLNGTSNNQLNYVRLGMDSTSSGSSGWILATENSGSTMLAKFLTNGLNPIADADFEVVDDNVALVSEVGTPTGMASGDVAVDGAGRIYLLANGGGNTWLFIGIPDGTNTTLEHRWTIQDSYGNTFPGTVNGVCFDNFGGFYFSSGSGGTTPYLDGYYANSNNGAVNGIYYLNPATVRQLTEAEDANPEAVSIVQATLVFPSNNTEYPVTDEAYADGFTDLGTNVFPTYTFLPVRFGDISIRKSGDDAIITWDTYSEEDIDHYEVYRSEDGGKTWNRIGNQPAGENTIAQKTYHYTDRIYGKSGILLYRVRSVEHGGFGQYSRTVSLRLSSDFVKTSQLVPNPVNGDKLDLVLTVSKSENLRIYIQDAFGKFIGIRNVTTQVGYNQINLSNEIRGLAPGNYFMELTMGEERWIEKFTKQ